METQLFEKYKTSEVTNTRRVIHTPSGFIRKHFFFLQEAGCLRSLKPHLSTRSSLNSFLFLIVLSGSGRISYREPTTGVSADSHAGSGLRDTLSSQDHSVVPDSHTALPDPTHEKSGTDSQHQPLTGTSTPGTDSQRKSLTGATTADTDSHHLAEMTTVSASAGDCFFLDCMGAYTHISSADDPWELLWIHFSGPQAGAYYSCFREQSSWRFRSSRLTELSDAIWAIIRLQEEPSDDTDLLIAQQIVNILTMICTGNHRRETAASPLSGKLKAVQQYLDAHYTEQVSLDRLAEEFYISKYYLAREFRKAFGTTIIQYLLTKRITSAKELLRYSQSPIEDIARLCGIDDPSYFNKVFKRMEGCTASEYRKRW